MEAKIADGEVAMIAQPRDQVASFESTVLYMFVTLSDLAPQDSEDTASCAHRPPTHATVLARNAVFKIHDIYNTLANIGITRLCVGETR